MNYTLTVTKVSNRIKFLVVLRAWGSSLAEVVAIEKNLPYTLPECYYDPSILADQLKDYAEYSYVKNPPTEDELRWMSPWEYSPGKEELAVAKEWYSALPLQVQKKG
jgi:hypothetical protein